MKKITKAVIPVAGMGTRLLPATKSQPKEMIPVGKKPVIQYVVEEAAAAGIKKILIVTGSRKRSIEDHFDTDNELNELLIHKGKTSLLAEINFMEHKYSDVQIFYTRQTKPLGLGHAIYLSKDFIDDEDFVVLLGDTIIRKENSVNFLARLIKLHQNKKAISTIGVQSIDSNEIERYGVIDPKPVGDFTYIIKHVVEKPKIKDAPSNLAIAGRYVFNSKLFNELKDLKPGFGGEIQLTDAIQGLIDKESEKNWALGMQPGEDRYDIGNLYSYSCAFFDFCIRNKEIQSEFHKHVKKTLKKMGLE